MRFWFALALACAFAAQAQEAKNWYGDPFEQATAGLAGCAAPRRHELTEDEARAQAHGRIERGTSCALAGTCEPGGAYKRDSEINARVARAVRGDPRFADASVWVWTMRKFVTLEGCVRTSHQQAALTALTRATAGVEQVWNETVVAR